MSLDESLYNWENAGRLKNEPAKAKSGLMNLLCTHKEINDLAKKLAEIARCQTTAKQYFDWEPLAIELHKYVIYKDA